MNEATAPLLEEIPAERLQRQPKRWFYKKNGEPMFLPIEGGCLESYMRRFSLTPPRGVVWPPQRITGGDVKCPQCGFANSPNIAYEDGRWENTCPQCGPYSGNVNEPPLYVSGKQKKGETDDVDG